LGLVSAIPLKKLNANGAAIEQHGIAKKISQGIVKPENLNYLSPLTPLQKTKQRTFTKIKRRR